MMKYEHLTLKEYLSMLFKNDKTAGDGKSAWTYIYSLVPPNTDPLNAIFSEVYNNASFVQKLTFTVPSTHPYAQDLFIRLCAEYANQIGISYEEGTFDKVKYELIDAIIMRLDNTFLKYNALIYNYAQRNDHLMDSLTRHTIGETGRNYSGTDSQTATGQEKSKDTPQTTITLGDGYNSNVRDSSMENSTEREWEETGSEERTETYDVDSVIDKLNKIKEKFAKVWEEWLGEFKEFFLSKYNIGD